jgi:hypothetical protein
MELSYDNMTIIYHVPLYLYCIAYFLLILTTLQDDTSNVEKPFYETMSSQYR